MNHRAFRFAQRDIVQFDKTIVARQAFELLDLFGHDFQTRRFHLQQSKIHSVQALVITRDSRCQFCKIDPHGAHGFVLAFPGDCGKQILFNEFGLLDHARAGSNFQSALSIRTPFTRVERRWLAKCYDFNHFFFQRIGRCRSDRHGCGPGSHLEFDSFFFRSRLCGGHGFHDVVLDGGPRSRELGCRRQISRDSW